MVINGKTSACELHCPYKQTPGADQRGLDLPVEEAGRKKGDKGSFS